MNSARLISGNSSRLQHAHSIKKRGLHRHYSRSRNQHATSRTDMNSKAYTLTLLVLASITNTGAALAQTTITIFDLADTNKDGYVDRAEDEAANLKSFKSYDTDGDGKLSQPEMAAKFKGLPQSEVARGVSSNLALMDSDKDGSISWDEFKKWYYDNMFHAMDKDNDDRLTKDEFILNENAP